MFDLALNLEEVDLQIIPLLHETVTEGCKKAIVLCNDTDVLVLLLYYIHEFMCNGLSDLWMKFGIGDSSRYHLLLIYPIGIQSSILLK